MKRLVPVLIIVITILALLCGWLLSQVLHIRFHNETVADELNLLAVLATIIGAILAGAGIIVALVSIYTLWDIENRLKRQSDALEANIKDEIKALTDCYFLGFDYRLQSLNTRDPIEADRLMRLALENYPDLAGARSEFALRLFADVQGRFVDANRLLGDLDLASIPLRRQWTDTLSDEALRQLAAEWLDLALQHKDDPGGSVSLCRAELYGLLDRSDKMRPYLRSAVTAGVLTCDSYAVNYADIALLLISVRDTAAVKEVAAMLGQRFPMSKENVLNYASTHIGRMGARTGQFLVRVKPHTANENPLPDHVSLLNVGFVDPKFRIQWSISDPMRGISYIGLPPKPEPDASRDEIWKLIDERFWVIMPITPDLKFPDHPDLGDDL